MATIDDVLRLARAVSPDLKWSVAVEPSSDGPRVVAVLLANGQDRASRDGAVSADAVDRLAAEVTKWVSGKARGVRAKAAELGAEADRLASLLGGDRG